MPEENTSIQGIPTEDPKEYIRSLAGIGNDMEEKSKQEINKVGDEEQVLKDEKRDANLELQASKNWSQFAGTTGEILSDLKSSAVETLKDIKEKELEDEHALPEELEEDNGEDIKEEEDPLADFTKYVSELYENFKRSIPESLGELGRKAPDSTAFGEDVLKIVEFMDSLRFAKDAMQACSRTSLELPDEVRDSLIKIFEESEKMKMTGEKIVKNTDLREKKIREIKSNAERNFVPMGRTIERNPSNRIEDAQKLKGVVSNSDIQNSIEKIKEEAQKAPYNEVISKITPNMEERGATQEEIYKTIQNAKAQIDRAIKEERDNTSFVAPSSYTTPVS